MKYEWRKSDREFYLPGTEPVVIDVPELPFFMLSGTGDPNKPAFSEKVGALYTASYTIRMMPKGGIVPEGYYEYTVFPLEGIWDLSGPPEGEGSFDKNELVYTIMIRQPDFVTEELASTALDLALKKKAQPALDEVRFERFTEGLCVQMMHIGRYDDEPATIEAMVRFCEANNLARTSFSHHEIYLSDPRATDPENLKTVLRFTVEQV